MKLYYKFRNSSLDTAPLGILTGSDTSSNVYTPSGARIIGWAEDMVVHFCQVEGFGGMVFVVDPNAPPATVSTQSPNPLRISLDYSLPVSIPHQLSVPIAGATAASPMR